jgi:WS/DGAT/MGAT family acyltransferase
MFLYGETRDVMLHVASLMPFSPPADARPDHLRVLVDQFRATRNLQRPWNLKLRTPGFLLNPLHSWVEADDVDVEYHVRRSALPAPGDERELGVLVSRLHSHPLDFHRPPWELHLIEGLERNRFALYVKVHHALIDGFTAMRILARSLSTDPDDRDSPLFLERPPPRRSDDDAGLAGIDFGSFLKAAREQLDASRESGRAILDVLRAFRHREELVTPLDAPRSILNGPISRNRRFATQQLAISRLKAIAHKVDGTLNDVVLALCAGSLRRFLLELGALPDAPLIAMVPVNIRPKDDPGGGGNAVAAVLASLATHVADPAERVRAIIASTRRAKAQLSGLSRQAIIQYSALLMAPFGLQGLKLTNGLLPPAFNVIVSNVPGPEQPLYFRGSRLEACYPMSIPVHGLALNITCGSYAGNLNFGFIGCRESLPRLQRLAVYCGEALAELEAAVA